MIKPYNDSPEQASQVARSAIPLASKLGLPVNPHIYAVCYQYTSKLNRELCDAFDALLKRQPKPDKFLVELLYQKHIENDESEATALLNSAVESLMKTTENTLQAVEDSTQAYGESLGQAVDTLDHFDQSPDILKDVVKKLLDDTIQMNSTTQSLQEELSTAKAEAAQMQIEYKRIREESLTDPLTGINNRRAFDDAFNTLCHHCQKEKLELSLLVLDIDHFKKVNDTFGHAIGDAVLKCVGKILKNTVRGNDVPARFGGEEFTVLLPGTPQAGALNVAEKIRQIVEAQKLRYGSKALNQITVSIGLTQMNSLDTTNSLFERADAALYKAKNSGRNKVCIG